LNNQSLKVLLVHPEAKFMQEDKFTIAADCSLLVHKEIVKRFGTFSLWKFRAVMQFT